MAEKQMKRDVLWNAAGSLIYALASMVLAFIVIRLAGEDEGGIFGFGFSTLGQQMFIIAYFGIRPFQITDMSRVYSFPVYLRLRWLTCGAALAAAVVYSWAMWADGAYTGHKAAILTLLAFYKIVDGFADVYESELQREGCLYRTGQSLAYRTLLTVAVLVGTLALTGSLLCASAAACAAQLAGLYLFSVRPLQKVQAYPVPSTLIKHSEIRKKADKQDTVGAYRSAEMHPEGQRAVQEKGTVRVTAGGSAQLISLVQQTFLLFLSVFLDFYVFSASKYAVDAQLGNASSGFFNILFMPTSFIYLLANFVIRPLLTRLAEQYQAGERRAFAKTCRLMQGGVALLGLAIVLGALVLGRFGLGIFELLLGSRYAGRLTGEFWPFVLVIAGGAFYALANVQYYILVTMRRQDVIFAVYGLSAFAAMFAAPRMVAAGGMMGAAVCYLGLMCLMFAGFSVGLALEKTRCAGKET